jgi:lipopolysaccharide export LptBFGC system permease protein LptF
VCVLPSSERSQRGAKVSQALFGRTAIVVATGMMLVQPAFAAVPVPAPIVGAGLPALAILAGGYWLFRKLRERR